MNFDFGIIKYNMGSQYKSDLAHTCAILVVSNITLSLFMSLVYFFGKDSIISSIIIYVPISTITLVLIRDKYAFSYTFSNLLAIIHGIAHIAYPFLNENIGINKNIDVWQDQLIHLCQAILVCSIFFDSNIKFQIFSALFVLYNILNVFVGYCCWGQSCHNVYNWFSIAPSLASGLHFATGCLFQNPKNIVMYGFIIQGSSSIITYFLFKASDDMLKLFALCRFFELYFIVPHYTGYIYGRYIIYEKYKKYKYNYGSRNTGYNYGSRNTGYNYGSRNIKYDKITGILDIIGFIPNQISSMSLSTLSNYYT